VRGCAGERHHGDGEIGRLEGGVKRPAWRDDSPLTR